MTLYMTGIHNMDELVVIGDSWTYGSEIKDPGLPASINDWDDLNDPYRLPRIWPTKLAKMLGMSHCTNLSYPAASNDRTFRILPSWLLDAYIKPQKSTENLLVIVGLTSPERKDFYYKDEEFDKDGWLTIWPMWKHTYTKDMQPLSDFSSLYQKYFWNAREYTYRYVSQIFFLELFFKRYNIKHLFFQAFYQPIEIHIKEWKDNPYVRNYNGFTTQDMWDMIDPINFYNKNTTPHSFHNYITSLDPTPHKEISILGMHPSELGHTWWAENLYNYVNKNNIYIPKNSVDVVIHNVNQKTKGY